MDQNISIGVHLSDGATGAKLFRRGAAHGSLGGKEIGKEMRVEGDLDGETMIRGRTKTAVALETVHVVNMRGRNNVSGISARGFPIFDQRGRCAEELAVSALIRALFKRRKRRKIEGR